MQLDHVAVGITHEDTLRPLAQSALSTTRRNTRRGKPFLRSHDVRAQEHEVGDSWVLFGTTHEDVRLVRVYGV